LFDFGAGDRTADECDHSKLTAGCDDPRRHRSRRRLQFGARPTQYEDHALQRRYYHDGCDDNVRLAGPCLCRVFVERPDGILACAGFNDSLVSQRPVDCQLNFSKSARIASNCVPKPFQSPDLNRSTAAIKRLLRLTCRRACEGRFLCCA
jgi:hypothetical protein